MNNIPLIKQPKGRYAVVCNGELVYYSQSSNAYAHLMNIGKARNTQGIRVEVHRTLQWENETGLPPVDCACGIDVEPVKDIVVPVPEPIDCEYRHKSEFFIDEYDYEEHKNQYPRYVVTVIDSIRGEEHFWFTAYNEAEYFVKTYKNKKYPWRRVSGFYDTSELDERLNDVKTEWSIYG